MTAGDRVVEGQAMLKIESPPSQVEPSAAAPLLERRTEAAQRSLEAADLALEAQRRALERDATELETARQAFERFERLWDEGLIARLEYERERERLERLESVAAARRREFDRLRQDRSALAARLDEARRREDVARQARDQAAETPRTRTLGAPAAGYVAAIAGVGTLIGDEAAASIALAEGLTVRIDDDVPSRGLASDRRNARRPSRG